MGYPLYDVPHKQEEETLEEPQFVENYEYFMRVRLDRLAFFQGWLNRHFNVRASIDGDGVRAVSAWVDGYGGALIGDEARRATIFASYQPRWEGQYAGYNVIIDLSIFVGEYLISKRVNLYWDLFRGIDPENAESGNSNLYRPCLSGFPGYMKGDTFSPAYFAVYEVRKYAKEQYLLTNRRSPNSIVRDCQTKLVMAAIPNDGKPYMFGDTRNEPL